MFASEGDARTERANRILAGYLALVAGFANSCGFVFLGAFTSHVTGNVGRFADDLASSRRELAFSALGCVVAFYLGAFVVGLLRERCRAAVAYAIALGLECAALAAFAALVTSSMANLTLAALLCVAMGLQNGLVSRLSGAIVRTTHLTGVVTDLGVETARWLSPKSRDESTAMKLRLHLTIASAFTLGAILGAMLTKQRGALAAWVPVFGIACAFGYALLQFGARKANHMR